MKSLEQIAQALAGYDPHALPAASVNAFLAEMVPLPVKTETLGLLQALGRILAQDVISPIDVPPHDNSAMDGFAFEGRALPSDKAIRLQIAGSALAGKAFTGTVSFGECIKVMTGAILPTPLDTVVPQELVQMKDGAIEVLPGTVKPGDNRRLRGEDVQAARVALAAGSVLGPAALGLIASLGFDKVTVYRKLRVAYFSTGDEILSLGDAPREGAVYDSNRYTVWGLLQKLGVECLDLGVVPDAPQALETAFQRAAEQADAIITSGGVSVGEADHTKAIMRKLAHGKEPGHDGVAFWRIAMRPGRPMAVGRIGSVPLFGLPGNPVAVMVTFLAFVRPALWRMMGARSDDPQVKVPLLQARSSEVLRKKPGRTEYQRAIVWREADGSLRVRTTGQQGSGVLSSMVQANGLLVLAHDQGQVQPGDWVDVMMFAGVI